MDKVYCLKCRKHVQPLNAKFVRTKKGQTRLAGTCGHCKRQVSRFVSSKGRH
jgi:RNase P subunit RPR2